MQFGDMADYKSALRHGYPKVYAFVVGVGRVGAGERVLDAGLAVGVEAGDAVRAGPRVCDGVAAGAAD